MIDPSTFWDSVYSSKDSRTVSWYAEHLHSSLALLDRCGVDVGTRLIDVGGGASTLVDDLLARGLRDVTVLDVSREALAVAQSRLGEIALRVKWLAADITVAALPAAGYDLWHDRAVLHFLTASRDANAYARQAARAVSPGGHLVVSGFAPDGPEQCSGHPVARRGEDELCKLFAADFDLLDTSTTHHATPWGAAQVFMNARLRRR